MMICKDMQKNRRQLQSMMRLEVGKPCDLIRRSMTLLSYIILWYPLPFRGEYPYYPIILKREIRKR
jgi:hypothetical protein